jgi:tetratricopeptide (TPR) repeat protein
MRALLAAALAVSLSVALPQQRPPTPPIRPPASPPGQPSQPAPKPPSPRVRSATGDALDRYAAGAFDEAISKLGVLGGFNTPQAESWIRAQGPSELARRRLVAATLALEYTASRPGLSPALIEWGRDTARATGSVEWELLWLRASIALAEGSEAWTFLTPPPEPVRAGGATAPRADKIPAARGYLAEARARFPDEPFVKLAEAVGLEVAASPAPRSPLSRRSPGSVAFDRISAELLPEGAAAPAAQVALLERAASAFEPLLADESTRAEASLRLGFCRLRLGQRDRALDQFAAAARATRDPYLGYLAHLFSAVAHAGSDRADDATAAYRAALNLVPRARAATSLLTALLFMHHRLSEAESVATDYLSSPPTSEDPWRTYLLGDYRSYAGLLARLREAAR